MKKSTLNKLAGALLLSIATVSIGATVEDWACTNVTEGVTCENNTDCTGFCNKYVLLGGAANVCARWPSSVCDTDPNQAPLAMRLFGGACKVDGGDPYGYYHCGCAIDSQYEPVDGELDPCAT